MSFQVPPRAQRGEGDRPQGGGGASTVTRARTLRKTMSLPEGLLWQRLRRRAAGARFRRQHPLGPYVLDFYCASARLAVEIDGVSHDAGDRPNRDERRDLFLATQGLRLVRIAARDVLADPDEVADRIAGLAALPLHRPAGGPPPHASHGEELSGAF